MRFRSLDGKIRSVDLSKNCRNIITSKIQTKIYGYLQEIYGKNSILQEFIIPGTKMSLDFLLPNYSLAIEVDGKQHDKFNPFFHFDRKDFLKQVDRDDSKERWCKLNNFVLLSIKEDEKLSKSVVIEMILKAIHRQSE